MRRTVVVALVAVLVVLTAAGALGALRGDDSDLAGLTQEPRRAEREKPAKPQRTEKGRTMARATPPPLDLASLTPATTDTTLARAPIDPTPLAETDGDVVRPLATLPVFAEPGKRAFAKIPPTQFQETWLPVVDRADGWVRVLLPARPNGAIGWIKESRTELARSPYLVRVHLGSKTLELVYEGSSLGTWPVAVGEPATPTPPGRTFLLGSVVDDGQSYSPIILPLGSHSDTLDSYGGGPGTVALHGWPDDSVFGTAASHGCIRVPAEALDLLTQVPLGTLVVVDER